MTKKEFMTKHSLNEIDYKNLVRYEETRANGEMSMFEYIYIMKKYNINGGFKLADWIQSGDNYEEFKGVLENERNK